MAKRGTSAEEKLRRLEAFFTAQPEIYILKELEKKLPKACGVSPMSLAELIKAAVDDNMIRCEKVGAVNIYWSFPKQEMHFFACENEKMLLAISEYRAEIEKRREHLGRMRRAKEDSTERRVLLERHARLKAQVEEIERLKWQSENCSLAQYREMEASVGASKVSINKTTDDIFTLQAYVCSKYGLDRREFNASFGLKEDMDYVE